MYTIYSGLECRYQCTRRRLQPRSNFLKSSQYEAFGNNTLIASWCSFSNNWWALESLPLLLVMNCMHSTRWVQSHPFALILIFRAYFMRVAHKCIQLLVTYWFLIHCIVRYRFFHSLPCNISLSQFQCFKFSVLSVLLKWFLSYLN